MNECQHITKAICNKGFSGSSGILPRSNFDASGQERSPQSLTEYSLNRYLPCKATQSSTFCFLQNLVANAKKAERA